MWRRCLRPILSHMRSYFSVMGAWRWHHNSRYMNINLIFHTHHVDAFAWRHFPKSINLTESPFINAIIYLIRNKHSILLCDVRAHSRLDHFSPLYLDAFDRIMCASRTKPSLPDSVNDFDSDTVGRDKFIFSNVVTCSTLKVRKKRRRKRWFQLERCNRFLSILLNK